MAMFIWPSTDDLSPSTSNMHLGERSTRSIIESFPEWTKKMQCDRNGRSFLDNQLDTLLSLDKNDADLQREEPPVFSGRVDVGALSELFLVEEGRLI